MMFRLLKKEFALCLHPTSMIFAFFGLFVFVPNYPYEVAFFFSGLSVFFVCLTARENGDASFTCTLPVRKRDAAIARVLFCAVFQCALILVMGLAIAVKELCLPAEMQTNLAGSCANLALLGHGFVLLAGFNLIFFPWYFRNPVKVGVPFLTAAIVQFALIGVLCALRFTAPVYSDLLVSPDPANLGVKAGFFFGGLAVYLGGTLLACVLSAKHFEKTDL